MKRPCKVNYSNVKKSDQMWNDTTKDWGDCKITECDIDYTLENNDCVKNTTRKCSNSGNINDSVQIYDNEKHTWGPCIATKCKPGYTIINNNCVQNLVSKSMDTWDFFNKDSIISIDSEIINSGLPVELSKQGINKGYRFFSTNSNVILNNNTPNIKPSLKENTDYYIILWAKSPSCDIQFWPMCGKPSNRDNTGKQSLVYINHNNNMNIREVSNGRKVIPGKWNQLIWKFRIYNNQNYTKDVHEKIGFYVEDLVSQNLSFTCSDPIIVQLF
jgi:hypothetical protein